MTRKKANDYASTLLAVPRSNLEVTLRQTGGGVTLLHKGKAVTKCYISRSGMQAAFYMAKSLGVGIPALGSSVKAKISTGVLWRAVSISCLDFRKPESTVLLERLLEEAAMMRESKTDSA